MRTAIRAGGGAYRPGRLRPAAGIAAALFVTALATAAGVAVSSHAAFRPEPGADRGVLTAPQRWSNTPADRTG